MEYGVIGSCGGLVGLGESMSFRMSEKIGCARLLRILYAENGMPLGLGAELG